MKSINFRNIIFTVIFVWVFSIICFAQTNDRIIQIPSKITRQTIKSTAAYAEVLLRKTELEATLEDLSVACTEDFPKVMETRFELDLAQK